MCVTCQDEVATPPRIPSHERVKNVFFGRAPLHLMQLPASGFFALAPPGWDCARCTLHNEAHLMACFMCQHLKLPSVGAGKRKAAPAAARGGGGGGAALLRLWRGGWKKQRVAPELAADPVARHGVGELAWVEQHFSLMYEGEGLLRELLRDDDQSLGLAALRAGDAGRCRPSPAAAEGPPQALHHPGAPRAERPPQQPAARRGGGRQHGRVQLRGRRRRGARDAPLGIRPEGDAAAHLGEQQSPDLHLRAL